MDPAKPNQPQDSNSQLQPLDASAPQPGDGQQAQKSTEEVSPFSVIEEVTPIASPSLSSPVDTPTVPVFQSIVTDNVSTPPATPTPPGNNTRRIIFGVLSGLLLVGGTFVGVILVRQQQNIQEKAASYTPIACPITPAQNRVIVSFDGNFIRSDKEEANAKLGPVNTFIPTGKYKVTLVSYEKDHPQASSQPKELWYVKLNNNQGTAFAQTSAIGDMADADSIKQEVVEESFIIGQDVGSILAYHGAYKDTASPNSINPVCAVFEKLEETVDVQCTGVIAYNEDWELLSASDLQKMKAGDTLRFAVTGTSTSGSFDRAKFTINGTERAEVTTKKPATNEFYDEYTIPTNVKTFSVTAKIHHAAKNTWF